jgi:predicted nuclease with TOPRIM domain
MEQNEDLARLEKFVERLVESHNHLKNEKNELLTHMHEKELEIAELQEKIKDLQTERSTVHNRVTGLIDRIDEWEKLLDQDGGGESNGSGSKPSREPSAKKSSSLFSVKPEQASKSALR